MTAQTDASLEIAQRKVRAVLILGQIMAGLGMGATLSMGAILAGRIGGSDALSGMAATMATLGAALAAVPLASLASRAGRALSLASGASVAALGGLVVIGAIVVSSFILLLVGLMMVGVGTAVNLQSRFAATDIAAPATRGRDLSLVVWATTVGAVSGLNLLTPGEILGGWLGLPELAGPFVFTVGAQLSAAIVYFVGLRPDPLTLAKDAALARATSGSTSPTQDVPDSPQVQRAAIAAIALSHAVDGLGDGDDAGAPGQPWCFSGHCGVHHFLAHCRHVCLGTSFWHPGRSSGAHFDDHDRSGYFCHQLGFYRFWLRKRDRGGYRSGAPRAGLERFDGGRIDVADRINLTRTTGESARCLGFVDEWLRCHRGSSRGRGPQFLGLQRVVFCRGEPGLDHFANDGGGSSSRTLCEAS